MLESYSSEFRPKTADASAHDVASRPAAAGIDTTRFIALRTAAAAAAIFLAARFIADRPAAVAAAIFILGPPAPLPRSPRSSAPHAPRARRRADAARPVHAAAPQLAAAAAAVTRFAAAASRGQGVRVAAPLRPPPPFRRP